MGIQQVPDQVRKAPTLAIRAVFAGIGKILLATDRPSPSPRPAGPRHAANGRRAPRTEAAAAQASPRDRPLDETGNVRLLSAEELGVGPSAVVTAGPMHSAPAGGQVPAGEAMMIPVASQPLAGNVPVGASLVIHEVPLPGYDTMPLASIRARLRSLTVDQLQTLLVREHKNARRPEIIALLERRIEKLESGG